MVELIFKGISAGEIEDHGMLVRMDDIKYERHQSTIRRTH